MSKYLLLLAIQYITPDAIELQNNAIVVTIDEKKIPVSKVHVDNEGYYVDLPE